MSYEEWVARLARLQRYITDHPGQLVGFDSGYEIRCVVTAGRGAPPLSVTGPSARGHLPRASASPERPSLSQPGRWSAEVASVRERLERFARGEV